jgi:septal ring factor EnvC (AmiA/AmiB activator)
MEPLELSVEDQLKEEVDRLNQALGKAKKRINGLEKRCKSQKWIISKLSRQLRELDKKQMYINVQKGPKKKRG